MDRKGKFSDLKNHAFYKKYIEKLSENEIKIIHDFLSETISESNESYHEKCNRLFLDDKIKPKNWVKICDILISCT